MKITFATYFYNDFEKRWPDFIKQFKKSIGIYKNYELLLINNGGKKFDFISEDLNLRIIDIPRNICPGGAKRVAIEYALGEYIWVLDNDDIFSFNIAEIDRLDCKELITYEWKQDKPQNWHGVTPTWAYIIPRNLIDDFSNPLNDWDGWHEEVPFQNWIDRNNIKILKSEAFEYLYLNNQQRNTSKGRVLGYIISGKKLISNEEYAKLRFGRIGWDKALKKWTFEYLMWSNANRKYFKDNIEILYPSKFTKVIFALCIHKFFFLCGRFFLKLFKIEKEWGN